MSSKLYFCVEVIREINLPNIFRQFIRLKVHASGWPDWCKTEEDRGAFIEEYRRRGIKLDPDKMVYNAGQRYAAKLWNNRYTLV